MMESAACNGLIETAPLSGDGDVDVGRMNGGDLAGLANGDAGIGVGSSNNNNSIAGMSRQLQQQLSRQSGDSNPNSPTSASAVVVVGSAANSVRRKVALFEAPPPPTTPPPPPPATLRLMQPSPGQQQQQQRQQQPEQTPPPQQRPTAVDPHIFSTPTSAAPVRPRLSSLKRTASLPRPTAASANRMRERAWDRPVGASTAAATTTTTTTGGATTPSRGGQQRTGRPQPPDSLGGGGGGTASTLSRTQSLSMQRLVQRTPSLSRARTPGTPTHDDGRWPSVGTAGGAGAASTGGGSTLRLSLVATPTSSAGGGGGGSHSRRGISMTPDLASVRARTAMTASVMEPGASALRTASPYGTLPRRRKQKSVEELNEERGGGGTAFGRSASVAREPRLAPSSLSLVAGGGGTARRNAPAKTAATGALTPLAMRNGGSAPGGARSLSAAPKTRIYHETAAQTALTSDDLERALAGIVGRRPIDAAEQRDQQTQADGGRDTELERLRAELRAVQAREAELSAKLRGERAEKLTMQRELHFNTQRVLHMLELARHGGGGGCSVGTPTSDTDSGSCSGSAGGGGGDSLLLLESQIQASGQELNERQQEVGQLRRLCRALQAELERSLAAQECLLQERAVMEAESTEMQEFLQDEKVALAEALSEIETDYRNAQRLLASRDEEAAVLRDECRHLVRLNEQRRQENRLQLTQHGTLEARCRELEAAQCEAEAAAAAAVTGAASALSGLHGRLDNLVEQLIASYNIAERDLEDLEDGQPSSLQSMTAWNGGTPADSAALQTSSQLQQQHSSLSASAHAHAHPPPTPDAGALSPQRNHSFLAALFSAIRGAKSSSSAVVGVTGKRQGGVPAAARNGCSMNGGSAAAVGERRRPSQGGTTTTTSSSSNVGSSNENESDSTEMLESETEPCLMMDNVLEDVTLPDTHSHNLVSSSSRAEPAVQPPSATAAAPPSLADQSLQNLSEAITHRQEAEAAAAAAVAAAAAAQCNHDRATPSSTSSLVGEMPSYCASTSAMLALGGGSEYVGLGGGGIGGGILSLASAMRQMAIVDQVVELDALITRLLKVLRLIQLDNDQCIQQLIVDKNKLQEHKEDMLEKLKDLEDVNVKLQDDLMDATQELMLKRSELAGSKSEIQRHRNEIDRLAEDICNLSTLCSNYRKLSPTTDLPIPLLTPTTLASSAISPTGDGGDSNSSSDDPETISIISLLNMWQTAGQLEHSRIRHLLRRILAATNKAPPLPGNGLPIASPRPASNEERLRIYANQLENVWRVLQSSAVLIPSATSPSSATTTTTTNAEVVGQTRAALQQLRREMEVVRCNANWKRFAGIPDEPPHDGHVPAHTDDDDDLVAQQEWTTGRTHSAADENANEAATNHEFASNNASVQAN